MVFKPNYNAQRAERTRAKQAKRDEKLREREEAAARRKAGHDDAEAARAEQLLRQHGTIDLDARARQWRDEGWRGTLPATGHASGAPGAAVAVTGSGPATAGLGGDRLDVEAAVRHRPPGLAREPLALPVPAPLLALAVIRPRSHTIHPPALLPLPESAVSRRAWLACRWAVPANPCNNHSNLRRCRRPGPAL